jgi:hypothetical protein
MHARDALPVFWPASCSQTMCSSKEQCVEVELAWHGRPQYVSPCRSWRKHAGLGCTPGQVSVGQSASCLHTLVQTLRLVGFATISAAISSSLHSCWYGSPSETVRSEPRKGGHLEGTIG